MKKKAWIYANFALLMVGLGCSDALRGVFAPVFQEHFGLSASQLSVIVTISYVGNLLFMLLGSRQVDRFPIKKVFLITIVGWSFAAIIYLITDNYYLLLLGVFLAMGTSTLLNTFINFMTPMLFFSPGLIINTLFFVQGLGTTGAQSIIGRYATSFTSWKVVNLLLLAIGILTLVGVFFLQIQEDTGKASMEEEKLEEGRKQERNFFRMPAFWLLFLVFGFYFVGEHGIMNWMSLYCINAMGIQAKTASIYPALFFGGITLGRLLLAPLVEKLGILKSIVIMGGLGSIFYSIAILGGNETLLLLAVAGFLISIIYPTLLMAIQIFFQKEEIGKVTGLIISAATIFDIGFNMVFGTVIDKVGYHTGMKILPIAMVVSFGVFLVLRVKVKTVREL